MRFLWQFIRKGVLVKLTTHRQMEALSDLVAGQNYLKETRRQSILKKTLIRNT
jgi:hypothetical protein